MQCNNPIVHTIRAGDTVYLLARRYNTTVESVLSLNPGIEIYNLQIGSGLLICPGVTPVPPIGEIPPVTPMPPMPPIAILPPVEVLRALFSTILRWIREHFGEDHARRIMEQLCTDLTQQN